MAPQFKAIKGSEALKLSLCIDWARSSLPQPLSPVIKTVDGLLEISFADFITFLIWGLSPIILSKV